MLLPGRFLVRLVFYVPRSHRGHSSYEDTSLRTNGGLTEIVKDEHWIDVQTACGSRFR